MRRKKKGNPDPLDRHLASLPKQAIRDMEAAVDAAWNDPDPAIRARQRQLFGDRKPTVEEFIRAMAEEVKRGEKL